MFGAFSAAAPEIILLTLLCVVLVADLFLSDENRVWVVWLSIASLAITAWSLFATGVPLPAVIMDGAYIADGLSQTLKFAAIVVVGVGFIYAKDYLHQNGLLKGEYYLLGLFGPLNSADIVQHMRQIDAPNARQLVRRNAVEECGCIGATDFVCREARQFQNANALTNSHCLFPNIVEDIVALERIIFLNAFWWIPLWTLPAERFGEDCALRL